MADGDDKVVELAKRRKKATAPPSLKLSDEDIRQLFGERFAEQWRHVDDWGQWRLFAGGDGIWLRDETRKIFDDIIGFLVELSADMKQRDQLRMRSGSMAAGIERVLRSHQGLAAVVDQWDADEDALNCRGRVSQLDRDVGERYALPGDYFTKSAAVRPDDSADCPLWHAFLELVTGGDAELIDFLQRMCGYCLTGSVREQVLFFLYGPGGNGKSTFVNTLAGIMGDYAKTASMDTFNASRNEKHPTDLADLQGARLVSAMETSSGKRWDETRIKLLTGGDKIKARFMHQDFFEFRPVFKLIISGNSKPELISVDDAMRRRVLIVPFTIKITEEIRDKDFERKLHDEWPAILSWMIEGARHWQHNGLNPPAVVRQYTDDYLNDVDIIGSWLNDRTVIEPEAWENRTVMYKNYKEYCADAGERYVTSNKFYEYLSASKDLVPRKRGGDRGYKGRRVFFASD